MAVVSLNRKSDEKVFQKYNSIFKETDLKDYLDKEDIGRLVLCGMQTEYCVDASVKVGFEFDYKLVIPEGALQLLMEKTLRQKK